jgi:hypothetical protein
MSDKPSYLGLLNSIAVGEAGGEELFCAWASVTPSPDVKAVLEAVMLREGEHAKSFAKRINELGYSVIPKEDPGLPARVALVSRTDLTDCEKFEQLGFNGAPKGDTDIFSNFFSDVTMDVKTGELMGRYVAEERDTGRKLLSCYSVISAQPAKAQPDVAALEARLERIECALVELAAKNGAAPKAATKSTAKKR